METIKILADGNESFQTQLGDLGACEGESLACMLHSDLSVDGCVGHSRDLPQCWLCRVFNSEQGNFIHFLCLLPWLLDLASIFAFISIVLDFIFVFALNVHLLFCLVGL